VEHGEPLTTDAVELLHRLVEHVTTAVDAAGYVGGGQLTGRSASLTWTFPSTDVPVRDLVLAARAAGWRW
jgi:hypothetical protein